MAQFGPNLVTQATYFTRSREYSRKAFLMVMSYQAASNTLLVTATLARLSSQASEASFNTCERILGSVNVMFATAVDHNRL